MGDISSLAFAYCVSDTDLRLSDIQYPISCEHCSRYPPLCSGSSEDTPSSRCPYGEGAAHLHACAERSGHFCLDGNNLSNSVFVKERKVSAILVHFILDLEILVDTCDIK